MLIWSFILIVKLNYCLKLSYTTYLLKVEERLISETLNKKKETQR